MTTVHISASREYDVLIGRGLLDRLGEIGGADSAEEAAERMHGELIRTIDLNGLTEPLTFTVSGPAGENVIVAEPGRICVSRADCPDQVCVNMGWRSDGGFPIVCLPNKLVIEIESAADENPIDGVVG